VAEQEPASGLEVWRGWWLGEALWLVQDEEVGRWGLLGEALQPADWKNGEAR
jgi:hypothetical protein